MANDQIELSGGVQKACGLPGWQGGRRPAHFVLEPKPPNHDERLANDVAGHFRMALEAVGENNWDLDDFQALPPKAMSHLDLKAIRLNALHRGGWLQARAGESICIRRWDP